MLAAVVARLRRPQQWQAVARRAASAGAPSCLASFEVAAIVGRCLPGDPMKGSAGRARAMESHIERNLSDRCAGVCQQGLGGTHRDHGRPGRTILTDSSEDFLERYAGASEAQAHLFFKE